MITYASITYNDHNFHICSKPEIGDTIAATDIYFFFDFPNYCHTLPACKNCIFERSTHCEEFSCLMEADIISKYFPDLPQTYPELFI